MPLWFSHVSKPVETMLMTLVRFAMTETTLVEMVALKDVSSFNALSSVLSLVYVSSTAATVFTKEQIRSLVW